MNDMVASLSSPMRPPMGTIRNSAKVMAITTMITMTVLPLVRERDITIGWMYYQVIHRLSMDILHSLSRTDPCVPSCLDRDPTTMIGNRHVMGLFVSWRYRQHY